jgi:hypothetical protein
MGVGRWCQRATVPGAARVRGIRLQPDLLRYVESGFSRICSGCSRLQPDWPSAPAPQSSRSALDGLLRIADQAGPRLASNARPNSQPGRRRPPRDRPPSRCRAAGRWRRASAGSSGRASPGGRPRVLHSTCGWRIPPLDSTVEWKGTMRMSCPSAALRRRGRRQFTSASASKSGSFWPTGSDQGMPSTCRVG